MKKVYAKPSVYIETFELSQHIASCDFNVRGQGDIQSCYAVGSDSDMGNAKLFTLGAAGSQCEVDAEQACNYNGADMSVLTFSSY